MKSKRTIPPMKTINPIRGLGLLLYTLWISLLLLPSCRLEEPQPGIGESLLPTPAPIRISFSADMGESRTLFNEDQSQLSWEVGRDCVGLFIASELPSSNIEALATASETGTCFCGSIPNEFAAEDLFCAYYPYSASVEEEPAALELQFPRLQHQAQNLHFNGENNPLVSIPRQVGVVGVAGEEAEISSVSFRQLSAIVMARPYSTTWIGEEIRSLSIESNAPLAGSFRCDQTRIPTTGEIEIEGCEAMRMSTLLAEPLLLSERKEDAGIFAVIAPGDHTLTIRLRSDRALYTKRIPARTFQRLEVVRMGLNLDTAEREEVYSLVASAEELQTGDEVLFTQCVGLDDLSVVAMGSSAGNYRSAIDEVELLCGTIACSEVAARGLTLFRVEREGDMLRFLDAETGLALALTSGSNALEERESGDAYSLWSLAVNDFVAELSPSRFSDRNLRYNPSLARFACYSAGQSKISIFRRPALPEPTIRVDRAELLFGPEAGSEAVVAVEWENLSEIPSVTAPAWIAWSWEGSNLRLRTVEANSSSEPRTGELLLAAEGVLCSVALTQQGTEIASEVITLTFLPENYSQKVANYTTTWECTSEGRIWQLTNFNNNNSKWSYVKCGPSNRASESLLETTFAIPWPLKEVVVTIDTFKAGCVDEILLQVAQDAAFEQVVEEVVVEMAAGELCFPLSGRISNGYYRLVIRCNDRSTSQGIVQLSQVRYEPL